MPRALYPHQEQDALALAGSKNFLLAHGMRVGKTNTAIRAADLIQADSVLWLTPGAGRIGHGCAWRDFQLKDRPVQVILDGRTQPIKNGAVITSYALATGPLAPWLLAREWDLLVNDESHRLASQSAQRTKFVYGAQCRGEDGSLVAQARYRWNLSGTPAPKDVSQLWPMLRALLPETIAHPSTKRPMGRWDFINRYCMTRDNGFGRVVVGNKKARLPELRAKMAPFMLRRTLEEFAPGPRFMDMPISNPRVYADLVDTEAALIKQGLLDDLRNARSTEVKQALLDRMDSSLKAKLRLLGGLAAVLPVSEIVKEEIEDGLQKIVIFAWHREVIAKLAAELSVHGALILMGGSAPTEKERIRRAFMEDPARMVLVAQIEAAGEAIDLSVSDDIIFAEQDWVPGMNAQAAYRCSNTGKPRSVSVRTAILQESPVMKAIQEALAWRSAELAMLWGK